MKKWAILVLLILGASLLILQYLQEKGKSSLYRPWGAAEVEVGVGLPPASTTYATGGSGTAEFLPAAGDYDRLPVLRGATAYKGACEGGSLDEMIASHGTVWGYFAKGGSSFSSRESGRMYDFLGKYFGCVALARRDPGVCNSLPADVDRGGIKKFFYESPAGICRATAGDYFFSGYMAGKFQDAAYCRMVDWDEAVPVEELCAAAAQGIGPAGALAVKYAPGKRDQLRRYLPDAISSCAGDPECAANFSRYQGIKNGVPGDCAAGDRPWCEALLTRSVSACDKPLAEMSRAYCAYAERVKKASGGYLGLTGDEIKAEVERTRLQKEETEKIQAKINIRVKKLLRNQRQGD